jgi:hypothetical protein
VSAKQLRSDGAIVESLIIGVAIIVALYIETGFKAQRFDTILINRNTITIVFNMDGKRTYEI